MKCYYLELVSMIKPRLLE